MSEKRSHSLTCKHPLNFGWFLEMYGDPNYLSKYRLNSYTVTLKDVKMQLDFSPLVLRFHIFHFDFFFFFFYTNDDERFTVMNLL